MLKELSIRNFAIIDDLTINFADGFTILSGETGAGKSIILNAVNLLLGSRASADLIRTGADTAELQALFLVTAESSVARLMAEQAYDSGDSLMIRRLISRSGSNRIYINDRLATMQLLNAFTENLASISGQHAHQGLLKEEQQLLILDQFGGLIPLRTQVSECFNKMLPLLAKLQKLCSLRDRQAEHIELLEFQEKEIAEASLVAGEDTDLESERRRLKNRELLYQTIYDSIEELYSAQGSVVERLTQVKKNLAQLIEIDPILSQKVDPLAQAVYQVEDTVDQFRSYLKTIQMDETRLETVEERLDLLHKLKRKYGGSLEAVISHLESVRVELSQVENVSERITAAEKDLAELHHNLAELTARLSERRKATAKMLAKKLLAELDSMRMAQTRFEVALRKIPADRSTDPHLTINGNIVNETGVDRISFLIAPNIGEVLKPLASIASGGELSRLVLALKAILAETDSVETLIFDEVDAGIGGSVAEMVGQKLAELSRHHQVICITHLPQIAKFGSHHFSVTKSVSGGRTRTDITPLSQKDRLEEIARMLGGAEITKATLDHAREMLKR
ncbi:MAG: DNA repair protein RecN [Desulfobacterales bacterium]|jgi:DNA repair protein RecN (Recombination protein N)